MPTAKSPRKGSLQFWPRKRASKFLPRVNWKARKEKNSGRQGLAGFIGYKAGMVSASVKDNTPNSLMDKKRIIVPATIIVTPSMKIFSIRFYKDNKVLGEVVIEGLDKELKRKVKLPKTKKDVSVKIDEIMKLSPEEVSLIVYSQVKKTGIKKRPDLSEIGVYGNSLDEKIRFIKENMNKELSVTDFFKSGELIDVQGLTKGHGFSGTIKRFGLKLKKKKSEKGQRRPGSLGPWHPARVDFRAPQAGQLGMFTRANYNNKILDVVKAGDKKLDPLKHFGEVKTDFIIVRGSVPGVAKRQLVISNPLRTSKKQLKKNFELIELR